jgi:hypothetical protein
MVIIGLALFVVAGVFGVDLAAKNRFATRNIHVFGENLGVSGSAHLYVLGAITGAVLIVGFALLLAGLRRKGSKATQHHRERQLITHHETELEQLRRENADLRGRLEALESAPVPAPGNGAKYEPAGATAAAEPAASDAAPAYGTAPGYEAEPVSAEANRRGV